MLAARVVEVVRFADVVHARAGGFSSAGRSDDEPDLQQERLYDVCESLFFLIDGGGKRLDSGRSPRL